jgi:hypothetical protein
MGDVDGRRALYKPYEQYLIVSCPLATCYFGFSALCYNRLTGSVVVFHSSLCVVVLRRHFILHVSILDTAEENGFEYPH